MADAGSGVRRLSANEYVEEDADVGPLALPSWFVKLPDLECALASLAPLAGMPTSGGSCGRPFCNAPPSCGVPWLPIGVASLSCGGAAREGGRVGGSGSRLDAFSVGLGTGLAFGDGWMSRVSRGGREPPLLRLPGTGGFRCGTADMAVDLFGGLCLSPSPRTQRVRHEALFQRFIQKSVSDADVFASSSVAAILGYPPDVNRV